MLAFMDYTRGLFVFTRDLRVKDNIALAHAARKVRQLDCLYVIDPENFKPKAFHCKAYGQRATQFLWQALQQLNQALAEFGQDLKVIMGNPHDIITRHISDHQIELLVQSAPYGFYEQQAFDVLQEAVAPVAVESHWQHTLFNEASLPFSMANMPEQFTPFRKAVENAGVPVAACCQILSLPLPLTTKIPLPDLPDGVSSEGSKHEAAFSGGCAAADEHLLHYFASAAPLSYKQTRNALDEWGASTKFSPWLAWGCLSAKQVWHAVDAFEQTREANESTDWIKFELLWREFFHWHLEKHQQRLFLFSGVRRKKLLTTFYDERFAKWCAGNTPYAVVNAAMKQLNQTGYISNRARQIVASCWVNELAGDWRYGAAYFQQQLIDYDVAANWGNWQYIAGVGADPRGGRHFDIAKQTNIYDPDQIYVKRWQGEVTSTTIDSFDMNGWPIEP